MKGFWACFSLMLTLDIGEGRQGGKRVEEGRGEREAAVKNMAGVNEWAHSYDFPRLFKGNWNCPV